ncbi:hypothetical protein AALP_AA5G213300 [Arabis alpina]|uniref:Uncharacterized protein n=1 Tax=Arabis alpina TaxID=50452 RepID=A0A087GYI4_ARAAL|nr:hypothetical protein AALP_AA5G213300 [Arabis alpina]
MAGLQYSFFPTDFFYPRASPPVTSLVVVANPKVDKLTQKRDGLVVIDDETRASLSLLIREKTTTQSLFDTQTLKTKPLSLWIEDDDM